jgi:hypothetical protein
MSGRHRLSASTVALWLAWRVIPPYVAIRDFLARRRQPHARDVHPVDQELIDLVEIEAGDDDWSLLEAWLVAERTRPATSPTNDDGEPRQPVL